MGKGEAGSAPRRQYDEDAPTQIDEVAAPPPRLSAPPTAGESSSHGSSRGTSASSSVVTARETLGLSEVHRTRSFLRVAIGLAVFQGLALPLLGGDATAKAVLASSLVLVVALSSWLVVLLRDDDGAYTVRRALVVGYATIFAVFSAVWFYGVFSPAVVVVPLGLQFYCTGQSDRANVAVVSTCALVYAALGGLVLSGALPEVGLVKSDAVSTFERVVMLVIVEVVFAAVYIVAQRTRAATLLAIEQHDVVVRSLAQRDALLREARHELVHAMRVGGVGRYSGEIVGPFRLGSVIGRGAMGEVYDAVRLDTNEEAAMKLVHPQLLAERDVVDRFLREAKITSALSVAHVVRVVDASPPDAPIPYLAMERLRGEDLATFLRDRKRMGIRRVLTMLRQVGVGLDAAHAAGVIHRDLKPRNLFCARAPNGDELWKILDFGVSKLDGGDGTLTRGQLVGTPAYMAPEQASAREVGPRADIFALGVIAYRALTGNPPFSGETSVEILARVCHAMPPRPSDLARLPPDVDLVLAIALAKDPQDRFATAAELAQALDAASRGKLDERLSARAAALLEELPWGSLAG